MADAYTGVAASTLDQTAYNLAVDYSLRANLHFAQVADVKPTAQAHAGAAVVFTIQTDMAIQSAALSESVDPDAIVLADSQVTLTLVEQGAASMYTAKLAGSAFVPVDPIVMNIIERNARITLDELAAIALRGGTNVVYATGGTTDPISRLTVESSDVIAADDCRKVVAQLRAANVDGFDGDGTYAAFIHPDVVYDLEGDTGASGWLVPANYSEPSRRWNGEIGKFQGARYIEASRAPIFSDAGSSTTLTDVYATLVMGRQGLAMGHSIAGDWREMPSVVARPPIDKLMRFHSVGWKWFGVFGRYREAALRRIESSSSIGTNS